MLSLILELLGLAGFIACLFIVSPVAAGLVGSLVVLAAGVALDRR